MTRYASLIESVGHTPLIGLPNLSPKAALIGAVVLGIPATWLAGRWVRGLLDEAAR